MVIAGPTDDHRPIEEPLRPAGECGSVAAVAQYLRENWAAARADPGLRDQLIDSIQSLADQPLGDAIEAFIGEPLPDERFRDALNALPTGLKDDLIQGALGALNGKMDFKVSVLYSTNGAAGSQTNTWYADGSGSVEPDAPPLRHVSLVCPSLHHPLS